LKNKQITDFSYYLSKSTNNATAKNVKVKYTEYKKVDTNTETASAKTTDNNSTYAAPQYAEIYYYHSDHLGTGTFLSDFDGNPYQFFLNLPFGETMAEQHSYSGEYTNRYKFNGKELDEETGFYYYGARYYNPKFSIWLSVDPLAEKFPNASPYNYCLGNPINLVDPDGRAPSDWIHWYAKDGSRHITYDKSITTVEQANQKGYNNYNKDVKVYSGAHLKVSDTEQYYMNPDGMVSNGNGSSVDIDDTSIFTSNGITISENKGVIDAFGDYAPGAISMAGDALTAASLPVAATGAGVPLATMMASFGTVLGRTGTILELVNDGFEGKLSGMKVAQKLAIDRVSRKMNTSDAFGPVEQRLNDNIFSGLDKTLDLAREQNGSNK
jgi:RHS repeat-associated protein